MTAFNPASPPGSSQDRKGFQPSHSWLIQGAPATVNEYMSKRGRWWCCIDILHSQVPPDIGIDHLAARHDELQCDEQKGQHGQEAECG